MNERLKILMWAPDWDNRWLPYFKNELSSRYDLTVTSSLKTNELFSLSHGKDLFLSMWGEGVINLWGTKFPNVPIISYLRRYEAFFPEVLKSVFWDKVSALIFVNDAVRAWFEKTVSKQPKRKYTIYNAVDLDAFPLLKSSETVPRNIAFVCKHSPIKNFPLAAQILYLLPEDYRIYHIGRMVPRHLLEFMFYLESFGLSDRFIWHNPIPASEMPKWYADKDFMLSTSINEGNPNNVIEGMACGLKPVVHAWPGADTQFPPDAIFRTAEEAAQIIREDAYQPLKYRQWVEDRYSLDNIRQIHRVIEDVCGRDKVSNT